MNHFHRLRQTASYLYLKFELVLRACSPLAAGGSEDCFFLVVEISNGVKIQSVPVLHWLYGGFVSLFALNLPPPDLPSMFLKPKIGLVILQHHSKGMHPEQPFITVSSNYRLGATSWIYSSGEDMAANVGIWDGIAAL
jgi:carboxylesterase type B